MTYVPSNIFDLESNVKSYCIGFPAEFTQASGAIIEDIDGKKYFDLVSGCGSLNYGLNNKYIKEKLIEYILYDGIALSLDMNSSAKKIFLQTLRKKYWSGGDSIIAFILRDQRAQTRLRQP